VLGTGGIGILRETTELNSLVYANNLGEKGK
jgi:hypothetical protein